MLLQLSCCTQRRCKTSSITFLYIKLKHKLYDIFLNELHQLFTWDVQIWNYWISASETNQTSSLFTLHTSLQTKTFLFYSIKYDLELGINCIKNNSFKLSITLSHKFPVISKMIYRKHVSVLSERWTTKDTYVNLYFKLRFINSYLKVPVEN